MRLRNRHMQKIQTIVAGGLGMPRGKKGSQAVRLEALECSEKKARERLAPVSQSAKRWLDRLGKVREEAQRWTERLLEKKEWKSWISSTLRRLRCLEQGLKETASGRIDRLKETPAAQVGLQDEKRGLAPTGRFTLAPGNKVQGSKHSDLKPKTTLDFLFKSCNLDFRNPFPCWNSYESSSKTRGKHKTNRRARGATQEPENWDVWGARTALVTARFAEGGDKTRDPDG